jgi:hypothetical protein
LDRFHFFLYIIRSDPYKLRNSCGLEYELNWVPGADRRNSGGGGGGGGYGRDAYGARHGGYRSSSSYGDSTGESSGAGNLFMLLVVGFIAWGIFKSCTNNPAAGGGAGAAAGGTGGGGGG